MMFMGLLSVILFGLAVAIFKNIKNSTLSHLRLAF